MNSEPIKERGPLAGQVALVTGASSGIGRAIAVALSRQGVRLCIVGRDLARLALTSEAARRFTEVKEFQIDLTVAENITPLFHYVNEKEGRLNILVHSAGLARLGTLERTDVDELDLQYATNVRAPYLLTQRLLPLLTATGGQIIFINSSAGLSAGRPEIGQYGATKHALKAVADSLRAEVNPKGVRVLSMYLGRTATPMQETLYRQAGIPYDPPLLMQPEDVASMIVSALLLPATAEVTDISIRAMHKSY